MHRKSWFQLSLQTWILLMIALAVYGWLNFSAVTSTSGFIKTAAYGWPFVFQQRIGRAKENSNIHLHDTYGDEIFWPAVVANVSICIFSLQLIALLSEWWVRRKR